MGEKENVKVMMTSQSSMFNTFVQNGSIISDFHKQFNRAAQSPVYMITQQLHISLLKPLTKGVFNKLQRHCCFWFFKLTETMSVEL